MPVAMPAIHFSINHPTTVENCGEECKKLSENLTGPHSNLQRNDDHANSNFPNENTPQGPLANLRQLLRTCKLKLATHASSVVGDACIQNQATHQETHPTPLFNRKRRENCSPVCTRSVTKLKKCSPAIFAPRRSRRLLSQGGRTANDCETPLPSVTLCDIKIEPVNFNTRDIKPDPVNVTAANALPNCVLEGDVSVPLVESENLSLKDIKLEPLLEMMHENLDESLFHLIEQVKLSPCRVQLSRCDKVHGHGISWNCVKTEEFKLVEGNEYPKDWADEADCKSRNNFDALSGGPLESLFEVVPLKPLRIRLARCDSAKVEPVECKFEVDESMSFELPAPNIKSILNKKGGSSSNNRKGRITKAVRFKIATKNWKSHNINIRKTTLFPCNKCYRTFLTKEKRRRHGLVKHPFRKRPFRCELCGKGFATRTSLYDHIRRHMGEKPYACQICKIRFVSKRELTGHEKRSHSGFLPHGCTVFQTISL